LQGRLNPVEMRGSISRGSQQRVGIAPTRTSDQRYEPRQHTHVVMQVVGMEDGNHICWPPASVMIVPNRSRPTSVEPPALMPTGTTISSAAPIATRLNSSLRRARRRRPRLAASAPRLNWLACARIVSRSIGAGSESTDYCAIEGI
jgi:hypothetical protein